MTKLTKAQALRYDAIFEVSRTVQSSANGFQKELKSIFGIDIFPHFLRPQAQNWRLSDYFKNLILLTKFLTCLALEKEDDSVFHPFYHKIAAACVTFLKQIYPEQKKDEDLIYTAEFEALLHDTFFNSLCIKPGEIDRVTALFSTQCAIAASKQLIVSYQSCTKEHYRNFAQRPSFSRLPARPSVGIVSAIDAYKVKIQGIIKEILVTQAIEQLNADTINIRLQRLAHKLSRAATAKISLYQMKEQAALLSILSFGIIVTTFSLYQTGGDLVYTGLALSLSILLLCAYIVLDDSLEKKTGKVSSLTEKIKSDLESQEEELTTQGSLEKQIYETLKRPSPIDISIKEGKKEEKEEEKRVTSYPEYFFGFNGLQPTQTQIRKMHASSSSSSKSSFFFPKAPLPVKEILPPHYKRDSSGLLIFFDPDNVQSIGKSESRITPKKFSESTYFVHKPPLSDKLKRFGISAEITFKLKPQTYSNVRAYGITEARTINDRPEEVRVVTHLLSKAH